MHDGSPVQAGVRPCKSGAGKRRFIWYTAFHLHPHSKIGNAMPDASHGPVARQLEVAALDVAIVGGGLAGLHAIHRLRGMGLKVRAYEAGSGVGGTWFWNRYPGARCDVESLE